MSLLLSYRKSRFYFDIPIQCHGQLENVRVTCRFFCLPFWKIKCGSSRAMKLLPSPHSLLQLCCERVMCYCFLCSVSGLHSIMGCKHLNPFKFPGSNKSQRACAIQGLCSCSSKVKGDATAAESVVETETLRSPKVSSNSKCFLSLHIQTENIT